MPAGGRAGNGLPGRQAVPAGEAALRDTPGRLPALYRVPGPDARNHQPHRTPGARRPESADAGRVRRAVPAVEVRAAVRRPLPSMDAPSTAATGIRLSCGSW